MKSYQITQWYSHFIKDHVKEGDFCIDATAGNGYDTLLLAQLCKERGRVLAFDIQETAISNTRRRLEENCPWQNWRLIKDSHENMESYAAPESAACIVFNFGYLPGGDHRISTRPQSSLHALDAALRLLKKGGLLSLCIYSGGDTGFQERDAILPWLKSLDPRRYLVIKTEYYNRPNHPPIPVLVHRLTSD